MDEFLTEEFFTYNKFKAEEYTMKVFEGYTRGINLGGWLSQCDNTVETYENFIREEDIRRISEWGLDHIRIPVD